MSYDTDNVGSTMKTLLAAFLLFAVGSTYAAEQYYTCTASDTRSVGDSGRIESDDLWNGSSFVVYVDTGRIHGDLNNDSWSREQVKVLDPGSDLSSFKVMAFGEASSDGKGWRSNFYLEIHQWVQSPQKPFVALVSLYIVTGSCRLSQEEA